MSAVRVVVAVALAAALLAASLPAIDAGRTRRSTAVVDAVLGKTNRVSLAAAGRTLADANRTLAVRRNATLERRRGRLREAVAASVTAAKGRANRVLRRETSLKSDARETVVADAAARWTDTGRRALAVSNGSFARAVAAEAGAHADLTREKRDWLAVRLRTTVRATVQTQQVRVPAATTNRTAMTNRRIERQLLAEAVGSGLNRSVDVVRNRTVGDAFGGVLAGLPVAPVPGYWYATVNVWTVTVRGSYLRFVLRAPTGPPNGAGAVLRYVRDGSAVTLDGDGDGDTERLGRSERISFEARTVVVIGVPAGRGVGDVDGDADERSAGWRCPGYEGERCDG